MNRQSGAAIALRPVPALAQPRRAAVLPGPLLTTAGFVQQLTACAADGEGRTTLALLGIDGSPGTLLPGAPGGEDMALGEVERATRAALRGSDMLGAMRGAGLDAEFGVLFTDTGLEEAVIATERLRAALAALRFVSAPALRITVSFGLAGLDAAGAAPALRQAAAALAEARRRGGNRCLSLQRLF